MKPIHNENEKLFTEMRLEFQGKIHTSETMIIDTNSPVTVISHQLAQILGIEAKADSTVIPMDSISIGPLKVSDFPVEIKDIGQEGIIGIDFLMKVGAKINLDSMTISSSRT